MSIQEIANWIGWPVIAAILVALQWFFIQRTKLLKENVEFLREKLEDCRHQSPDELAKRLAERYKILSEELERLQSEKEGSVQRVEYLERELEKTRDEAVHLRLELLKVQDVLADVDFLPRDGRVRFDIAKVLLALAGNVLYLFVRLWEPPFGLAPPYCLGVVYPGMHKTYLELIDKNGETVGIVENHFGDLVYDRDYAETVKAILDVAGVEQCPWGAGEAQFTYSLADVSVEPIDDSLVLLRVDLPLEENEILAKLGLEQNGMG